MTETVASVKTIKTTLDVIPKYETLVRSSFNSEGTFVRAKENIEAMFKNYSINSADKAGIVSNILGSLTSSIASVSMSTALQWATEERKLELEKQDLALRISLANKDEDLKLAQVKKTKFEAHAIQADSIRMMGTRVFDIDDDWVVTLLGENGKVVKDMEVDDARLVNMAIEGDVLKEKIPESRAAVHKLMAETYVNYGYYTYDLEAGGAQRVTAHELENSLSAFQKVIAKEQAKGYTYNAWSNAVTASAGMVGTVVAADGMLDDVGEIISVFRTSIGQLRDVVMPTELLTKYP